MKAKKPEAKAQRDKRQLAALTQRITDIYSGAYGGLWDESENWPSATDLTRIVPAIKETLQEEGRDWMWSARYFDKWETPTELAKFLYEQGIRA